MSPTIPIAEVKDQLLGLDYVREQFARTEPLEQVTFSTGEAPAAVYGTDESGGQPRQWHARDDMEPAPVWLDLPRGERYQLTRQAASQLASECHITQGYQEKIPASLLNTNVAWWLGTGLGTKELKLLCAGRGVDEDGKDVPLAVALCRETVTPFSNQRLLDVALDRIRARYGEGEVLADYKFHHTPARTDLRLIVPEEVRVLAGTGDTDDRWSVGLNLKNSSIGLKQTMIDGYLFRFLCTNGLIDTSHSSGGFQRRGSNPDDVYTWAAEVVDEVLGGLESTLDGVQDLAGHRVEGSVRSVIEDLCHQYGLPKRERNRIIAEMAEIGGDLTMYDILNAITRCANLDDVLPQSVDSLMTLGGHVAHVHGKRCGDDGFPCRRLLPDDYVPPRDGSAAEESDPAA